MASGTISLSGVRGLTFYVGLSLTILAMVLCPLARLLLFDDICNAIYANGGKDDEKRSYNPVRRSGRFIKLSLWFTAIGAASLLVAIFTSVVPK